MERVEDVLYIVMPAYNEGENIRSVVEDWIKVLDDKPKKSRLIVADSGSTDNTHNILLSLKKKYKNLEILEKTNQYHGPKVIALYDYAIKRGANYIFQTDSDGQTDSAEFESFWKKRKRYDAILGFRSKRGDGKARAIVEKVVCLLLRLFFDVKVPDANAPFRLMKASLVEKYLNRIPKDYDLPNIVLTAYFARFNENINFEEVSFKPRVAGVNSINLSKIFRIGKESLSAFAFFRKDMKKSDRELAKSITRRKIGSILISFSLVMMAALAISTSPSSPWNRGETVTDSGVFLTIGVQMKNGLTPYVDTFDHKGPVLYVINYLGVMLNETSGILVFEFTALLLSLIFMYKIAKLKVNSRGRCLFLSFVAFSLYLSFNSIDRGNLVEEYAMPLIAISTYIFLKYFMGKKISNLSIILTGICFALVFLLRVNMISIWVVFSLVIIFKLVYEKKYRELLKLILLFSLGTVIVFLVVGAWLLSKGAFEAFIDAYFKFNTKYSRLDFQYMYPAAVFFVNEIVLLASLVLSGYYAFSNKDKNKLLLLSYFGTFLFALIAVCVAGRSYPHYGMVLIPLVIFPFSWFYCEAKNDRNVLLVASLLLLSFVSQNWLNVSQTVVNSFYNRHEGEPLASIIIKSCEYIEKLTEKDDKIVVYGNRNYIYLRCNRLPASRFSYQYPIGQVRHSILQEFYDEVSDKKPKLFIVQEGYVNDDVLKFLDENGYKEEWRESKEKGSARIYSHI